MKFTWKILNLFSFLAFSHCNVLESKSTQIQITSTPDIPANETIAATNPNQTANDFLIESDTDYDDKFETNEYGETDNDDFANFDGRIVGGNSISIRQIPYQVSLQYNKVHICGGTIVAQNLIITAAHCIEATPIPLDKLHLYKVRVGSTYHKYGGQLLDVKRIIRHELYSEQTLDNDVAIIVLAARLTFNQNVKAARVAKQTDVIPAKRNLWISGWGITSETGNVSPILRYVSVRLINDVACSQSYKTFSQITSRMFCAGYSNGGRDSCQGDSGGPLVSYVRGKPTLFGVVSWGIGCAQKGFPGVYAKVSSLRPWINQRITELKTAKII